MQHLDEGFLHALADGEVPSDELDPVREHLEACETCRARLDEARMEAETARELIEVLEVPALAHEGTTEGRTDGPTDPRTDGQGARRVGGQWVRGLALAASLVLAAGIGYYGRGSHAPFAPQIEPTSLGRIDTVFLDVPASVDQPRANDSNRNAGLDRMSRPAEPQAPPPVQAPATARANEQSEAAGARRENDKDRKRSSADSVSFRRDELTVAAASEAQKASTQGKKEVESKLSEPLRQRVANDARDQAVTGRAMKASPPQAAAPPVALAEERLMAKSAADAAAVVVTFPRAVELLGGRIKLIEGMVPVRLEAVGRMVRVIYLIDEGDLVLSQVSAPDSLSWSLSGPLSADSLARLRLRVR